MGWVRSFRHAFAFFAIALLLAACGGGDSSDPSPPAGAPVITTQPANAATQAGQAAAFGVEVSGTPPLTFQWQRDGSDIAGATSATFALPTTALSDDGAQFRVRVANSAGSALSEVATLTVLATPVSPSITLQPVAASVLAGQPASFSADATGSDPLIFQWRLNGTDIAGATGKTYTTAATSLADDGAVYSVHVSNDAGSVLSAAVQLSVTAAPIAPSIAAQPAPASVTAGESARFNVTATGTAPLTYQWRRNGVAIPGATLSSYATPSAVGSDDGSLFSVVVTNAAGNAVSAEALLTVTALPVAPTITSPPVAIRVTEGQAATFTVSATGSLPLAYQWLKNGVAISGANAPSFTTPAATLADNLALFSVRVTNVAGAVVSAAATLTVDPLVMSANNATRISVGDGYALAVRSDGTILAWGQQMAGGSGPTVAGTAAHVVDGLSSVVAVVATSTTGPAYAIRQDGSVLGWGDGQRGTLGIVFGTGDATIVSSPTVIPQLAQVRQISAYGALALDTSGRLWRFPVLAGGVVTATQVTGIGAVTWLSKGAGQVGSFCCELAAIDVNGKVWAVSSSAVTAVPTWPLLSQIECSPHCLGIDLNGDVWAQGNNFYGQLGDGTNSDKLLPVRLSGISQVKRVAVGLNYSYAIKTNGDLYSWGDYFLNGRDDRIANNIPAIVPTLHGVEEISLSSNDRLVRLHDGSVFGWGYNVYGELATGTAGASFVPVQAVGIHLN